jgi:transposase
MDRWKNHIKTLPFDLSGFIIENIHSAEGAFHIQGQSTAQCACCPRCQQSSTTTHGWHDRHPQDLPGLGQTMRLHLQVRRFRCLNTACPQKTFVEQFPDWLPRYARRTTRLTAVLRQVAFEVSGEVGRRILSHFRVIVSGDTLLRIIRQTQFTSACSPRVIGVDDWAFKKGRRYGTIIVDLEMHRVIDVLPERTAAIVENWLRAHTSVEIVARDRSTEYAAGIQAGAPQAVQVADRWHLLLNLRQMLDRCVSSFYARLQQLPIAADYAALLNQQRSSFRRTRSEQQVSQTSREQRIAKYEHIQQLRQAGYNISQIAQLLGHHWETVRKYYEATHFPERKQRRPGRSILDPYLPYLEQRQREGCENAMQLWREIQQRGYPGSPRQVLKWMQLRRTQRAPTTPKCHATPTAQSTPPQNGLPSSKQIAWLLVRDPDQLSTQESTILKHVQQDAELKRIYHLAQSFVMLVKQQLVDQFDTWLHACEAVNAVQVQNFALGLRQDYAAVRAALALPWSNGQTEGQVNRLKFIKRQMYGRAKFDLLRLRVLHPP